jgi:hypothetical protein
VSLPSYEGPLLSLTGGVDCSFVLSGLVGGIVYLALTAKETKETSHPVEPRQEPARTESRL